MNNKKIAVTAAVLVGIVLIGVAIVYWVTPAQSLPTFMPGFEAGSAHIHFKHGVGSFILALAAFAYAWFKSGAVSVKESVK
jgi:amino acid permease